MRHIFRQLALCGAVASLAATLAAQPPPPDNTKANARDHQANGKTAEQQSNTKADVQTTRAIRQAIVADKDLSTNAHNVKIITRGGKVTLKGPVKTVDEKKAVEAKAAEVAGAANVTSQVRVMASSKTTTKQKGR